MITHRSLRREAQDPAQGRLVYFVPSSGPGTDRAPVYETKDLALCPGEGGPGQGGGG